jgi:hypothetical protein
LLEPEGSYRQTWIRGGLSLPIPAGLGAGTGFLGSLLHLSHAKLGIGLAATILVGTAAFMVFRVTEQGGAPVLLEASQSNAPGVLQNDPGAVAFTDLIAVDDGTPDPLKLLQSVAGARRRIASGSMELDLSTDQVEGARTKTRKRRLANLMDQSSASNRFAREYSDRVLGSDESPEARESVHRADSMESEEAVRAGLLKGFEAHVVTASDGVTSVRRNGPQN